MEPGGITPPIPGPDGTVGDKATVTITPDGKVTVAVGTSAHGQGHETAFAQLAADLLGVPYEDVTVVFGDSDILVDPNWGDEPNRNMVMNAFGWATNQVQKITIRPPDRDISTVDLDGPRLGRIRFLATDLIPFSLLGVGLAIWLNRRNK